MSHLKRSRLGPVLPAVLLLSNAGILTSACEGPARSAAALCSVFDTQGVAQHNKYQRDANKASAGPLPTLVDAVLVPQQFASLMGNMAAVAPTPIESDLSTLNTYFKEVAATEPGAITDPLKTLASSVVRSIQVCGSFERVNKYLLRNCSLPGMPTTP